MYIVLCLLRKRRQSLLKNDDPPAPRPLFNRYAARSRTEVLAALGATRVRAFEANARRYERKARLWYGATLALAAGAIPFAPADSSGEVWWSFRPLARPTVPEVHDAQFAIRNPIDTFVLARPQADGLRPALSVRVQWLDDGRRFSV